MNDMAYVCLSVRVCVCADGMLATDSTYVEQSVDERIVARVAHCQPVAAEPDDVDVSIPGQQQTTTSTCRYSYSRLLC